MNNQNSRGAAKAILAAAEGWFCTATGVLEAEPPVRVSGPVTLNSISEYADLVHHLTSKTLVLRGSPKFRKFVRPSLFGVIDGFVLPRAEWAPMTRDGRVLAFEMVINIEGVASVLRGAGGARLKWMKPSGSIRPNESS